MAFVGSIPTSGFLYLKIRFSVLLLLLISSRGKRQLESKLNEKRKAMEIFGVLILSMFYVLILHTISK